MAPTESGQAAAADTPLPPSRESIAAAFPHLEILDLIGFGGMGYVYKARQPKLDRLVALKILPQKAGADPATGERFHREARVLARLSHPNVVAVYDFGQVGAFFFLLMEYVDGVNLRQAMRAGGFTPAQALTLVPKICEALQYAHEEGVLHRDIKPENLLLDKRGRLKIADFGIAKLLGQAQDITLTASGATLGTAHYMAPEQLERPQDVDQRADVYSLGVVFYEMLTGELPIGRFAPPSEKASVDPRLDAVVLRALEKERERRFQTAGEVKTNVEQITANPAAGSATAAEALKPGPAPRGPQAASTKNWLHAPRGIGGGALVALSLVFLFFALAANHHVRPGEAAVSAIFIGLPALAGTLISWRALLKAKARREPASAGKLAFISATVWPMGVIAAFLFFVAALFTVNVQRHVLHVRGPGLVTLVMVTNSLLFPALAFLYLRKSLKEWHSDCVLPFTDVWSCLRRVPTGVLWISGLGAGALLCLLLMGLARINAMDEAEMRVPVSVPTAPPGYETPPGGSPDRNGRSFHTTAVVPAGYVLTVTLVLHSNQVPFKVGQPAAYLVAPAGDAVRGTLNWRLTGNTTFADGAPLELAFGLFGRQEDLTNIFHLVPPEPITVDWVGEPSEIWPPSDGHTKFLLIRGTAANSSPETADTEWSVGVESRLDPIPGAKAHFLTSPVVGLGTNWNAALQDEPVTAVDQTVSPPESETTPEAE